MHDAEAVVVVVFVFCVRTCCWDFSLRIVFFLGDICIYMHAFIQVKCSFKTLPTPSRKKLGGGRREGLHT